MTSLEEFKGKQLDLLHELDRVCEIAGIKYYLAYGTCLGAVRHQGIYPGMMILTSFCRQKKWTN